MKKNVSQLVQQKKMSATWTPEQWAVMLASVAGLVASCFAGARLSNCVKISICGESGWLYIERRLPEPRSSAGTLARSPSTSDVAETDLVSVAV